LRCPFHSYVENTEYQSKHLLSHPSVSRPREGQEHSGDPFPSTHSVGEKVEGSAVTR
jgi:hypothetical protein